MKKLQLSNTGPSVGVAVLLWHQQRVLVGLRTKAPMAGSWQLPGGWLKLKESPDLAVSRLLSEFSGMQYGDVGFAGFTNNIFDAQTHSVSLYFSVKCIRFDADKLQDNKRCQNWQWVAWNELPQPLFLPLHLFRQSGIDPLVRA